MNLKFRFLVFDIETTLKQRTQIPTHVGFYMRNNFKIFESESCVSEFLNEILQFDYCLFIHGYAHNFANFDSFFIVKALIRKQAKIIKMFVRNNNIIFLKCKINKTDIYFRDSFLYVGLPLYEIFEMYG
jgi:hypothetical protein